MSKHVKIIPPPNIPNISAAEARLQRISRDILPLTPYLLTVPSLYNLSSHQVNDWKRGCPFDAKEERLQYLTFRSHFDKDTIFHAVGDWDDGKGNILSTIDRTSGLSSPLPGQPPKKKMSFLDYKNKAAGHASTRQTPAKADGEVETAESGDTTTLLSQKSPNPSSNQKPHGTKRFIHVGIVFMSVIWLTQCQARKYHFRIEGYKERCLHTITTCEEGASTF